MCPASLAMSNQQLHMALYLPLIKILIYLSPVGEPSAMSNQAMELSV